MSIFKDIINNLIDERANATTRGYSGMAYSGEPLVTVKGGSEVYRGNTTSGFPIFTISGGKLYAGATRSGFPLAQLIGNTIYPGMGVSGTPMATISGDRAYAGVSTSGRVLATSPERDKFALMAGVVIALS